MTGLSASWVRLVSSARLQRSSQVLSIVSSKACIFGGELLPRQPVDNRVDVIDLSPEVSEVKVETLPTPDLAPSPRVGTASVTINDHIWLFSGRGGVAMDPVDEKGDLWRYTPSTAKWDLIRVKSVAYPESRSYHAMASDGKKTIYLHAGCPAQGRLSDLWAFDTEAHTWTELPAAPGPARGGTSIAFCQGKLYRMGGFDGNSEQGGELDTYDTGSNTWQTLKFEPDGIHGPGARSVATLLVIKTPAGQDALVTMFGERDPSALGHAGAGKMLSDVWAFDLQGAEWTKVSISGDAVPAARGWFDADVFKGRDGDDVVVHGGLAGDNTRLGDVWKLVFELVDAVGAA
ncbi:kelch domain-containing protein [Thelonectria olida]|uniref:Kelch domain-containing protein n=1 Tax=Thelonectria olida TaxID=1576542 RepID=A0A9P8W4R0_9HYPO|nr:kelch domain-containing protein [Thelonectria olida]